MSSTIEPIYGQLPKQWRFLRLKSLVEEGVAELQTGPFGTTLHASSYQAKGTPVIAVQHIGENSLRHGDFPLVDEETAERLSRYRVRENDILFGRKGSVDRRALIRANESGWIQGSDCIRLRFDKTIDARYISYVLGTSAFKQWIIRHAHGATMPSLNQEILGLIPIPLPPLPEQKRIAHILGTLDDKIELNWRMNATLEAMARALFKSWFIDFDPVLQNMNRNQPSPAASRHPLPRGEGRFALDPATAALFPSEFQDSPLGKIPKGWEAGTVNDAFNFTMGQSPPGDTYTQEGDGIPFYQGCTDFGFRFPTRRILCTAPTRYAKAGDTLVSVRAPVGDINMANEDCCIGRGVAAVRHKTGATSFTYHAMASLEPDFAKFEAEGTVFGSINKQNFQNLNLVIPPPEIIAAYESQASLLDEQIYNLEHQSRTLARQRDTLLPKLLRGELSVANLEN